MPLEYNRIRKKIERSFFASGMLSHLDELSEPALRRYLAEFFPALIRSTGRDDEVLTSDLLDMTAEVLRQQKELNQDGRTGEDFDRARYADHDFMGRLYLNGLTLALLFWPNHWRTLRYLEEALLPIPRNKTGRLLDLGSGHGLYSARFAGRHPEWTVTAMDISPHALERTGRLWDELGLDRKRLSLLEADVVDFLEADGPKMDMIFFCELLEHLSDCRGAMERVARRLAPDGIVLLTTALNSYFYDHLTYFNTIDEVKAVVDASGLEFLSLHVHKIADTPQGPQSDVIALLVHKGSGWTERLGRRSRQDGLHHVGVLTQDMEAALSRWQKRGAEVVFGPVTDLRMDCRVAFLETAEMPVLIELIEPYSSSSKISGRISANRLDHLCFQCEDLDAALGEYESQGARLTLGPLTASAFQRQVAFVIDTEGLLIEILQKAQEYPWFV